MHVFLFILISYHWYLEEKPESPVNKLKQVNEDDTSDLDLLSTSSMSVLDMSLNESHADSLENE